MDSQGGTAYDPSQPWAVTDALLGILARTLLKSTYQTRLSIANLDQGVATEPEPRVPAAPRQPSQAGKSTARSSLFWTDEDNSTRAASHAATTVGIKPASGLGPAGSVADYSGHQLISHISPAFHGSPDSGDPSSYSHSQAPSQAPSRHIAADNDEDADEDQSSTPGLDDGVSPMMIDPNLAAWHGEGHGHEQESFLHQYSDMGGDYGTASHTMMDPNLALMHDHDDFRHERHYEEGHLDDFEGGHHLNIPSVRGGLKRSLSSPYFADETPAKSGQQPSPRRRQRGIVSCIPFPRLTADYFGLIQEQLAHDPFWLLIVVTFLIRTTGKAAIPVFWRVMQRFPTPAMLDDDANIPELTQMIRHLGLASTRVAAIRRYASGWIKQPPLPSLRYRVKDYARRVVTVTPSMTPGAQVHLSANMATGFPSPSSGSPSPTNLIIPTDGEYDGLIAPAVDHHDLETWEIGHLTQGQYAIDSWRIFCRDVLLGKALDWKGGGREAEFQPEWMRVLPQDKELRAYLRWMWMKEGWQWDPVTGARDILSEEMRAAVEEGRVAYNDDGELEIVEREDQLQSAWAGV
ncbi:uncharacterized protein DNG_01309 [Cephalotrichum gorgonifer]|uniref:HhH-GPD domain-containing protein n=1 Tax=Cephalotrichum gorgonifer TaxID=2041049 RepID=A0AAE8MQS0_9PEZI|nr:uncharacterized protein DNG_01309 [Cephalotrichum gorgonifer]